MKYLFKNKINIVLISILFIALGALSYMLFFYEEPEIHAIDFSYLNEDEVKEWFLDTKVDDYSIVYEYSDDIEEGYVISQSKKSGEVINGIEVVISKGKKISEEIELPTIDGKLTRNDLEAFFSEHKFTDVTYEYTASEEEKDIVIKMNVSGKVHIDDLIMVTLSAGKSNDNIKVTVPDFSDYTIGSIQAWAKSNAINLTIDYNVSDSVEKGKVMSQSVLSGKEISAGSSLKIVISDGKGITVPDFTKMSKTEIEKWAKDNSVESLSFVEEYSNTVEKGSVISSKPKQGVVISSDYPVKVTVSKGAKIEVKTGYEGKSVSELEKYLKSLNETYKAADSNQRYYSDTYAKDTVYAYETGVKEDNATIKYSLSLGKFTINADELNGLTSAKANEIINGYKDKKANISIKLNSTETNDSSKIGVTFGCQLSSNTISCSLGVKEIPQINANEYNGISESSAKSKMQTYKSNYNEGSITFAYGDMSNNPSVTYGCLVSGKNNVSCKLYRANIKGSDFDGLSKEEANSKVSNYNSNYNAQYKVSFTSVNTDSYPANKTYGCSISGSSVSCNVAAAIVKAEIMDVGAYAFSAGNTYEATLASMKSILSGFTNVTYNAVESTKNVGQIVHITVNGVKDSYDGGEYPIDTPIVVEICFKQKN